MKRPASTSQPSRTKSAIFLGVTIIALFFLWDTLLIYPLQLLVVFFHESAHAVATIATGGRVVEMALVKEQGGHVISQGGMNFVVLSAGYLGSLLIGAFIYWLAETRKRQDVVMLILAVFVLVITILFIRPWQSLFGFGFSLVAGIGMMAAARYLSSNVNSFILRTIGLTSLMYVPLDIYSDTIARSHLPSDAAILAETYGGTTWFWGGFWLLLSIVLIFWVVRMTFKNLPAEHRRADSA